MRFDPRHLHINYRASTDALMMARNSGNFSIIMKHRKEEYRSLITEIVYLLKEVLPPVSTP